MSFINGLYIFAENEEHNADVEVSQHPVEKGIPITDTVKTGAEEVSFSGSIVDYTAGNKEYKADTILSQIEAIKKAGTLVTYNGRRAFTSMQITGFSTNVDNSISGGYNYNMTLQKCRIVSNAYTKDGGKQQVEKGENTDVYYTVKKGDCVAALVAEPNAPYKNLKREGAKSGYWGACNWVMEKNPSAFSKKGDFRTLQIGKKLLLGAR